MRLGVLSETHVVNLQVDRKQGEQCENDGENIIAHFLECSDGDGFHCSVHSPHHVVLLVCRSSVL